jgi:hypothetical protein
MGRMLGGEGVFWFLRGEHGIPDRGRDLPFHLQSIQGELIFVDTAEQFKISRRSCSRCALFSRQSSKYGTTNSHSSSET